MSSWQLNVDVAKNALHWDRGELGSEAKPEREAGTTGNPMLQLGGEQEAVTDPDPGNGVEREQLCRHPEALANTPGRDALQVREILLSTIPPLTLGKEVCPITSVSTAVTVCELPFAVTKVVWLDCCTPEPSSSTTLWIGQVEKKSSAG